MQSKTSTKRTHGRLLSPKGQARAFEPPLFHSMFAKTLTPPLLLAKDDDILLPRALSFPTEKHGENSIKKHIHFFL